MKKLIAHLQKYYGIYLLIVAVIFLILWFPNRTVNRYAICMGDYSGVWILDTKTGQLYFKGGQAVVDFGTLTKPIIEVTSVKQITELVEEGNTSQPLNIPKGFELEEVPKK